MPNPLEFVTEDQRDDPSPIQRLYVSPNRQPEGEGPILSGDNGLTRSVAPLGGDDLMAGLAKLADYIKGIPVGEGQNLLGESPEGRPRYQLWPERMVRSGITAPHDAMTGELQVTDPETGRTTPQAIERAMDTAGLAGGSTLFAKPGSATLGSGLTRPGAKVPVEPAPVFYSALEHAATNAAQDVMSPQQWLGFLKNQPGVKAEELSWTGLPEWLGKQKGKVSKEDVKAYLDEHKVEIKDVTKSGAQRLHDDDLNDAILERVQRDYEALPAMERSKYPDIDDWMDAPGGDASYARHRGDLEAGETGQVKYESYQLPGGENYREHLLTMPSKVDPRPDAAAMRAIGADDMTMNRIYGERPDVYRSSHWDEPNVLAHVRTNDRHFDVPALTSQETSDLAKWSRMDLAGREKTGIQKQYEDLLDKAEGVGGGKKSLHIEEIQSDWHQQGRKQGYKNEELEKKELTPEEAARSEHLGSSFASYALEWRKQHGVDKDAPILAYRRKGSDAWNYSWAPDEYKNDAFLKQMTEKNSGVPDAPFKTTWPELALKRMIRHAAENGYDRVSWTPGEAQAARYDLSKQIDSLEWYRDKKGNYELVGNKGETQPFVKDDVPPEKIADYVGKDIAEKIIKDKGDGSFKPKDTDHVVARGIIEGDGLKVGGEGMREFYDKMLPKMAEKIGKAHGVKVKTAQIDTAPNFDIKKTDTGGYMVVSGDDGAHIRNFPTKAKAKAWVEETKGKEIHPVHYFDLPQSLKDHAIGKGFPLYLSSIPFPLTPIDYDPFNKKKK